VRAVAGFEMGELADPGVDGEGLNRHPSASVMDSWAPGCGRSRRRIARVSDGQPAAVR
jgi:hypothetical protein